MNPAIETFITFAFVAVVVCGVAGWLTRPIWVRIYQFLRRWHDEDRLLEEAKREQLQFRERAETELKESLREPVVPEAAHMSEPSKNREHVGAMDNDPSREGENERTEQH